MGNYANASLEERIERRRKKRRAARCRKLFIFVIILAIIAGLGFGAYSLFSKDEPEEPVEVVEQDETAGEPADVPEEEPEAKEPDETETVEEPESEPDENTDAPVEEEPADEPIAEVATAENAPVSFNAVKGTELLAQHAIEIMAPVMTATYTQINAKMLGSKVDPEKPMVAITFDDGPSGKYGPQILDVLENNGARASFFVLGELIEGNSANLKRAVDMGCEIGNHSYDHPSISKLSAEEIKSQYSKTNELIKKATGNPAALVRTPGGAVNKTIRAAVGAPIISWSLDTVDWKSRNTDAIVKIVLDNVRDGDIILLHEIYKTTAEAVEIIVPELIKKGYQLVTVSEMMEAREVTMESGKVYFSAYPKKKTETNEETKTETTEEKAE